MFIAKFLGISRAQWNNYCRGSEIWVFFSDSNNFLWVTNVEDVDLLISFFAAFFANGMAGLGTKCSATGIRSSFLYCNSCGGNLKTKGHHKELSLNKQAKNMLFLPNNIKESSSCPREKCCAANVLSKPSKLLISFMNPVRCRMWSTLPYYALIRTTTYILRYFLFPLQAPIVTCFQRNLSCTSFFDNEGRSRTQITVYSLETKAGLLFVDQGEELSPTIIVNLCIVLFIFSYVNPSGFQDRCSGFIVRSRCSHRLVLQAISTVVKTLKTRKAGFQ